MLGYNAHSSSGSNNDNCNTGLHEFVEIHAQHTEARQQRAYSKVTDSDKSSISSKPSPTLLWVNILSSVIFVVGSCL